jgi:hypothetical protein
MSWAWTGDFSRISRAEIEFNFTVQNFFTVTVLCSAKYLKMHEAANLILNIKNEIFKILKSFGG